MRLFLLTVLLSLTWACSSKGTGPLNQNEDSANNPSDTSGGYSSDSADEAPHGPAQWFGIEGSAKLGEQSASSTVTVLFYAEDTSVGPICSFEAAEASLTLEALSPDESIGFWWESKAFEDSAKSSCEDAERLPPNLQLGIGRLHASILPYLTAQGMESVSAADGVYGAYIGFNEEAPIEDDSGTAFVLGYAKQDLSGEETEVNADPSHGNFEIAGVFLFPLIPESDSGIVREAQ